MATVLNHTIVPARDKGAAARFFADVFGLPYDRADGYFAKVRVNGELTLLFDDDDAGRESHHLAFHVSDGEFDAILARVKAKAIAFGSGPDRYEDGKLNDWGGGCGFYFKDPDGHLYELMTVPQ